MGWFGRSIGDFGSQVGQGFDINLGWKERLQNMALQNARQKIADLMGPLQVQEIQQRIKQMQQPREAGIVKGPGGETSGVTFDPATGTYSVKTLIPGAPPEPKFPNLQAAAAYYLQKGDFEKLKAVNDEIERTRPQKTAPEPKDAFELWRAQNPNAPVSEWLKVQESSKKKGPEGGTKTPFELWMQTHPKGTYDEWMQASKQVDRADALRAVTTAMNAFKNYQSQVTTSQRIAGAWSVWKPGTWGSGPVAQANVDTARRDFEAKRLDAIQKLQDAGMPVPPWLSSPMPGSSATPPPPPPPESGLTVVPGA